MKSHCGWIIPLPKQKVLQIQGSKSRKATPLPVLTIAMIERSKAHSVFLQLRTLAYRRNLKQPGGERRGQDTPHARIYPTFVTFVFLILIIFFPDLSPKPPIYPKKTLSLVYTLTLNPYLYLSEPYPPPW